MADPWVIRHTDSTTGSVPAYDRIEVRRVETLQGLAFAEPSDAEGAEKQRPARSLPLDIVYLQMREGIVRTHGGRHL